MADLDWQSPPRRASTREERRECVETLLRGAGLLLVEARQQRLESLAVGLQGLVASATRLKELLEGAGAEGERRRPPSSASVLAVAAEPGSGAIERAAGGGVATLTERRRPEEAWARARRPGRGDAAILVVDDNPLNREMLSRRLAQKGYEVDEAADGLSALERIAARRYDLVLLDIMMPGLSGTDVLARVRERHSLSDLPVIMATAKDSAEDVLGALRLGANDYVTKPLDFPIVHARVEVQLSYKRAKEEALTLARDLSASNHRLEEVQRRLVELQQGATNAPQGFTAWTRSTADGIASLLGGGELGVFVLEEESVREVTSTRGAPPSPADLESARHGARERTLEGEAASTLIGLLGSLGELHGGLVVPGRLSMRAEAERHLVESFARSLGTALDLQKVRGRVAELEARQLASREEMISRGIDVLQVCPFCRRCYSQEAEVCAVDGSGLRSPRLLPFVVGGRYRLVRQIGEGGMGTVFEADDERLGRRVALKIMRSEIFGDPEGHQRFANEARALAGIDDPGVIRIFDSGELEDGSPYLVMELLAGLNLKDLLETDGRGSFRQVASLIRQAAAALESVHAVGLLHRDIKPENFFCTKAEVGFRARLIDFGVAKSMFLDSEVTRVGTVVGTPRYMSPEQVQDRPLDVKSDLYSLAVVAYEALSGVPVVRPGAIPKVMMDVITGTPRLLSHHLPELPREVVDAFQLALQKEPERRPRSARDWAQSFVGLLERTPDDARGWTFGPRLSPRDDDRTITHEPEPA